MWRAPCIVGVADAAYLIPTPIPILHSTPHAKSFLNVLAQGGIAFPSYATYTSSVRVSHGLLGV